MLIQSELGGLISLIDKHPVMKGSGYAAYLITVKYFRICMYGLLAIIRHVF